MISHKRQTSSDIPFLRRKVLRRTKSLEVVAQVYPPDDPSLSSTPQAHRTTIPTEPQQSACIAPFPHDRDETQSVTLIPSQYHPGSEHAMTIPQPVPALDHRYWYRLCSVGMPLLPVNTARHLVFPEWWADGLFAKVSDSLRSEGIKYYDVDIVRRTPRYNKRADSTYNLTILVTADATEEGAYTKWIKAAQTIQALLAVAGRTDLNIEIVDSKVAFSFQNSVVQEDEVAEAWKEIQMQILDEISNMHWHSIDVLRRCIGQTRPYSAPTVYITASDAEEQEWWDRVLPRLKKITADAFDIEIVLGGAVVHMTGPEEGVRSFKDQEPRVYTTTETYGQCIPMGSSIGVHDEFSGTAGGYIELRDRNTGELIPCAITNHHVVAKHKYAQINVGEAITPKDIVVKTKAIPVYSPSLADHKRMQENLSWRIKLHRTVSDAQYVKGLEAELENLNAASKDSRLLGHVIATSGFRAIPNPRYSLQDVGKFSRVQGPDNQEIIRQGQSLKEKIDGKVLDWGVNWALIRTESRLISKCTPIYTPKAATPSLATAKIYQGLNPRQSYNVAKYGRTSEWSTGKIGKIGSILKLRYDEVSVVPAELEKRFEKIVLAYGILDDRHPAEEFLVPGDSGSLVLLQAPITADNSRVASIIGLGYAGNEMTMVSYMSPIDLIIEDIEKTTGYQVVIPASDGDSPGEIISTHDL